jgi:phage tail sheath protein FI
MVQVSYPGVYIVEKSSGVKTITGVATSIAAFFGRTLSGPTSKPVRCLSYADFLRNFGGGHPSSDLGASIKLFYDNGGSDCYVVRLAGANAQAAAIDLRNSANASVLRATAKAAGIWGNGLRLQVSYGTPNPGETFNLTVQQEEAGKIVGTEVHSNLSMDPASPRFAPSFVTQSSALIRLGVLGGGVSAVNGFSEARRPLGADFAAALPLLRNLVNNGGATGARKFEISVNGSAYVAVDLTGWDMSNAAIPDQAALIAQLQTRVNDALARLVPAQAITVDFPVANGQTYLRMTAQGTNHSVRIRRASGNDLASVLMMGVENGGLEVARFADLRPVQTGSRIKLVSDAGDPAALNAFATARQNSLTTVTIDGEAPIALPVLTRPPPPNNEPMMRSAVTAGSPHEDNDGVREKLRIIANAISNAPGSRWRAETQGFDLVISARSGAMNDQPSAIIFAPPGNGVGSAAAAALNGATIRNVKSYAVGPNGTSASVAFNAATQTGNDGDAPDFAAYAGDPVQKTGFYALDNVDLFNLMVLPADLGLADAVRRSLWGPASIYAHSRRAFLLLDAPDGWTDGEGRAAVVQNTDDVNTIRATVVKDHSAIFYPKLLINDGGLVKTVGPSGAIAGLLARTDGSRGVWKAPAGTEADLRGIVGLHTRLTDLENGVLNKLGVNCARGFTAGYVNWGARTLDGADDLGSEWKYIPIRRLALMIEESLYRGTQWAVFEPNDEPLWARIRLNVGVFMNGLFRQGAFQGSTRSDAFFVKCDGETTTQADRNLGIVNIEVGFAPLKPAEFVVITIQQMVGDLN